MFPRFNLVKIRKSLLVIFLVSIVFSSGYFFGVKGFSLRVEESYKVIIDRQIPPDRDVEFSLFWKVWDILSSKYFDKTKLVPSDMVYGAVAGMVAAIGDPYTVFLAPKENKTVNEDLSGSFEGVGIQIGFKGTRLAVIAPLPDSPAEKAGIKPGDLIVGIKDKEKKIDTGTSGMNLPDAVQIIRGKAGTKVSLTLLREGSDEPIIVTLTRAKLDVASVVLKFVGEGEKIAHVRVNKFSAETDMEWKKAVDQIISKGGEVHGIVVDLRNNPGGYLQASVTLASDFMDVGKVVVIEERSDGTKNEFKVEKIGSLQKIPVVVLVNEGSASASEILAGALRDQRKFKLIGVTTFGKGTIQEPIEIPGGSGLHVTTAKWLTPNGTWVHGEGLKVDIEVKDDEATIEDEQLQGAIKTLN